MELLKNVLEELARRRRNEIQVALRTIKGRSASKAKISTEVRADAERQYWIFHHVIARGRSIANQIVTFKFNSA
eukprot:8333394-Ditylum_brightwellii.AAC.1